MTRRAKLGGVAVVIAVVCFGGWHLVSGSSVTRRIRRHLPLTMGRYFAPKPTPSPRLANLPKVYLWAWERPEDLQFLGNKKVGVAFLAKTISLAGPNSITGGSELAGVDIHPRMQPLRIVPRTPLMAVVRIETRHGAIPSADANHNGSPTTFSSEQTARIAKEIAETAQVPGVNALQIDFDATTSEHALYRDLLVDVRRQLPPNFPLSITALASWCIGDRWLEQLPPGTIDEAVPMLFRMGPEAKEIENYIRSGSDFRVAACGGSLGVSTDEPFSQRILENKNSFGVDDPGARRIYVFSPKPWEKDSARAVIREVD